MSHPLRVCTAAEMKQLDLEAEEHYLIAPQILMENAGRAAVQVLFDFYPDAGKKREILIFAGKGNNAGDAFAVARRLFCLDRKIRIFLLVDPEQYQGPSRANYEIAKQLGVKMTRVETAGALESFFMSSSEPYVMIDGILGTGLKGELAGLFYDVIQLINKHSDKVISLDIPSGVSGDTGRVQGLCVEADLTVSFGFPKLGHFLAPGAAKRGNLVNVDISLPPKYRREGTYFLMQRRDSKKLLRERNLYGHKNTFGHVLVVGGSEGKYGAPALSARAALRMGAGLVTVATFKQGLPILEQKVSEEIMCVPLPGLEEDLDPYRRALERYSTIVIGPGLGTGLEADRVVREILSSYGGPLVVDADALNLVAKGEYQDLLLKRGSPAILTPHPGEMARLMGQDKELLLDDPFTAMARLSEQTGAVIALKGASTFVGSADEKFYLNHHPNDGMATAGSGDILAGMIGGLLSQGSSTKDAARLGVFMHSLAGELAAESEGSRSMTGMDVIAKIGEAYRELEQPRKKMTFPEEARAELL